MNCIAIIVSLIFGSLVPGYVTESTEVTTPECLECKTISGVESTTQPSLPNTEGLVVTTVEAKQIIDDVNKTLGIAGNLSESKTNTSKPNSKLPLISKVSQTVESNVSSKVEEMVNAPQPNASSTTVNPPIPTEKDKTTSATTTTIPTTTTSVTTETTTISTLPTTPSTILPTTTPPSTPPPITLAPNTTSKTPITTENTPTDKPTYNRRFDGPSFIGGIVFALGVTAIAFVAWKFYKARTERNYHTL